VRRYVLTYRPAPVPPEAELAALRQREDVRLLDRAGRSVYVECSDETAERLAKDMPDWTIAPEAIVPLPDPKPRVRKKESGD
jgi:hypothetical protein